MTPEEQAVADAAALAAKKVEFTPEQQEHINRLFNQRFAKVAEKNDATLADLTTRLAAAEEAAKAVKKPVDKSVDNADADEAKKQMKALLDAEKLRAANAESIARAKDIEITKYLTENKKILKDQAIRDAAASMPTFEFHDLKLVQKLVEDDIEYDEDNSQWVVKQNGVVKNNSSLTPMTLSEYFAEFAGARPFLVKGQVKGGAGSGEGNRQVGGIGVVRSRADLKSIKDKVAYVAKFGEAAFAALPIR